MDLDGSELEIIHREGCRCRIDGEVIYVSSTCTTRGLRRLSKKRLQQLLHKLERQHSRGKNIDPVCK